MASTSCFMPNSRSSSSFSVSDGTRTGIPGRLMPLCSPSMPPLITSQSTSSPGMSITRSSIRPSESRIRAPGSRFSASVGKVVAITLAVPRMSRGVMVSRCPAFNCTGIRFFSRPVRILGPCRSPRMQTSFPSSRDTLRTISMSLSFSGCVPWEKFSRATSSPARSNSRNVPSWAEAGPSVATILARRGYSPVKPGPGKEKFIQPPVAYSGFVSVLMCVSNVEARGGSSRLHPFYRFAESFHTAADCGATFSCPAPSCRASPALVRGNICALNSAPIRMISETMYSHTSVTTPAPRDPYTIE